MIDHQTEWRKLLDSCIRAAVANIESNRAHPYSESPLLYQCAILAPYLNAPAEVSDSGGEMPAKILFHVIADLIRDRANAET